MEGSRLLGLRVARAIFVLAIITFARYGLTIFVGSMNLNPLFFLSSLFFGVLVLSSNYFTQLKLTLLSVKILLFQLFF